MARVIQRVWKSGSRKVKRAAWGYTLQVHGRQQRKFDATWTKEDAQNALAARILDRDVPKAAAAPAGSGTLGAFTETYLAEKSASGKRSLRNDRMALARVTAFFGAATPLADLSTARIADFRVQRLMTTSERTKRALAKGSVNRELSVLRHMLRLAVERGELAAAPKIRLEREPQGRLRWLTEDEAARLLAACAEASSPKRMASQRSPFLLTIVTLALHTGMRKAEIAGLEWERVDFARGVIQLEITKSYRRREIPMNRAVYDVLSALPRPADGAGLVFRKADGRAWGNFRNAFERAVVEAKIGNFRFHDLRHTFASWLVTRGRQLKEVQELLGHQTIAMTMRYAHLAPDRLRDAVAALDDFTGAPAISTTSAHDGAARRERALNAREN